VPHADSDSTEARTLHLRILYVEDNPTDVELALAELRRGGIQVEADITSDRAEYEQLLNSRAYDLILADYSLPGRNGIEALEVLRRQRKDIPLILVTGFPAEAAGDGIRKGATDLVFKDRLTLLPGAVHRALQEKVLRDARAQAENR